MNLNFKRIIDFDKNELSYDILQRCESDFMYGRFGCKNFESDHPSQNISTFIHFLLQKITLIVLLRNESCGETRNGFASICIKRWGQS